MYAYAFDRRYGHDSVVQVKDASGNAGDLLQMGDEYFFLLGEDIVRSELYQKYVISVQPATLVEKGLLSDQTRAYITWFVNQRFSTYKKSLPLRLGHDAFELIKRKKKAKKQDTYSIDLSKQQATLRDSSSRGKGQQLVVFPDIWTLFARLGKLTEQPEVTILTSRMTKKQKAEAFRAIKTGAASCVCSTYAQIFQDWHSLQEVVLVDMHTWYYKHQQDPRYHAVSCAEKLASIFDADYIPLGYSLATKQAK